MRPPFLRASGKGRANFIIKVYIIDKIKGMIEGHGPDTDMIEGVIYFLLIFFFFFRIFKYPQSSHCHLMKKGSYLEMETRREGGISSIV
jgi:hypothetical protein